MEKQNVLLITLAMAQLISGASLIRGSETEVKPLRLKCLGWFPLSRRMFATLPGSWKRRLTLHAAAAGLQHPGVHVGLGVGQELVSGQVRVVGGGDEVVAKRLVHVLVHLVVQRVENVTRWASHETCETCLKRKLEEIFSSEWL